MVESPSKKLAASTPKKGKSGRLPTLENKEQGFVLAIDQATNCAGVSLWMNGVIVDSAKLLYPKSTDPFTVRAQELLKQFNTFMDQALPPDTKVKRVIFEGVRSRLVTVMAGVFCACPKLEAKLHDFRTFVETPSWKSWAKQHGATQKFSEIKGVRALTEVGFFNTTNYRTDSDDIADSILIYLTWRDRK